MGATTVGLEKNTGKITRTAQRIAALYDLPVDQVYRSMAQLRRLKIMRRDGRDHFLCPDIAWKGELERRKEAARVYVVETTPA